jgi:hypothetical protein
MLRLAAKLGEKVASVGNTIVQRELPEDLGAEVATRKTLHRNSTNMYVWMFGTPLVDAVLCMRDRFESVPGMVEQLVVNRNKTAAACKRASLQRFMEQGNRKSRVPAIPRV